ncbi:tetratricopeptide repeat protein [Pelagibacterium mangrovi]|uniref:tetratricopeptide repeat protein n=1 Tax=Pelagibacterium mangrovi TaxID=3119828 RepID=UPI002FCC26A4
MLNLLKRPLHAVVIAALTIGLPVSAPLAQTDILPSSSTSAVGNYLAGLAALEALDANRAASMFVEAARADWDNEIYSSQAFLAYLLAGNISEAASMAQHVLDLNPDDELAHLVLGTVALKQRRYASADQMLSRVPEASLIGIIGGITRAWAKVGEGDLPAANEILDRVAQGGFDDFIIFHRAIIADVGGDRAAALDLARQAYEIDPLVPRIAEAYIRILGNAGQFEEAQAILDFFASEGVEHPVVDVLRDPIAEGRKPGLFAGSVQSGAAEMLHGLGTALARDGSVQLGVAFLQLATYLDPDAAIISISLGELLASAGQYDTADEIFSSVPANSPLHVNALVRLAENVDMRGDRDTAISRLQNISVANPDNQEVYGILGDTLRYAQRWDEAAEAYSGIIERIETPRRNDWRFFYVRGIAYERAGDWDLAEADFLAALELSPNHPDVLNYLGYSWVDRGMNLEQALGMIERAVELAPMNGYIVDSLGWAFYKLGRVDEAVAVLEKAVQILPADPEINDHLGDVYWSAGREREAMFQWRIAIDVDEDGTVTERATPKLLNGLDPDAPIED